MLRESTAVIAKIAIDDLREYDYEAVVRLFTYLGPRYTCDPGNPQTKSIFNLYLSDERKHGVVARCGDRVAGVILYEVTPALCDKFAHARNDGVVIDPEFQGKGVGKILLRAVINRCREANVSTYMIKASDPKAIAFYRSMPDLLERGVHFYARL